VPAGTINPADLDLITLTDDVDEAVAVVQAAEAARVDGGGGGGMRAPLASGPVDA
jgi:hypothetical protein